jgi:hypothetical protein
MPIHRHTRRAHGAPGNRAHLPQLVEKPGRTQHEAPRRWYGQSDLCQVEVEYNDGRVAQEELRFEVAQLSRVQPHHLLVCAALGLDSSWYAVPSTQKKRQGHSGPLNVGQSWTEASHIDL